MKTLITRKKVIFIISIALSIVILSAIIFAVYRINNPIFTCNDITHNLFEEYDHTDLKNKDYEEELINTFKKYKYVPYYGPLGNTSHLTYGLYDCNEKLLFQITIIGNSNIIQVTINGKTKTYQGK